MNFIFDYNNFHLAIDKNWFFYIKFLGITSFNFILVKSYLLISYILRFGFFYLNPILKFKLFYKVL